SLFPFHTHPIPSHLFHTSSLKHLSLLMEVGDISTNMPHPEVAFHLVKQNVLQNAHAEPQPPSYYVTGCAAHPYSQTKPTVVCVCVCVGVCVGGRVGGGDLFRGLHTYGAFRSLPLFYLFSVGLDMAKLDLVLIVYCKVAEQNE